VLQAGMNKLCLLPCLLLLLLLLLLLASTRGEP
jgi:hypothetical protein